ncbi:ABC transporter permease [Kribbella yunnanensis]|uniref:ABC transporter permease n=1 Tax=Kribbella yunnanensis TaxID=190194 RepID=UPI0031DD64D2
MARRLLAVIVQLVAISVAIFGALYLTPGRPEQILLGTNPATPEALAAIRARYHLDDSVVDQYLHWLKGALQLDFGRSIQTGQTVTEVLGGRLPTSLFLAGFALVIVLAVAIPLGLLAGVKANSGVDRAITTISTVGVSAPAFALGIAALYVFGVVLGWFPVYGAGDGFVDQLWHLTLPAFTLAMMVTALVARQTRAAALTVNDQDFMTFARARGLPQRMLWGRYLLRNSSLPVATAIGLVLVSFLGGAVVVEQTFSLPGVGSVLLSSIANKDVPMVQGAGMFVALLTLLANLFSDVSYLVLDPRHRKRVLA